jgi:hypothetical protein
MSAQVISFVDSRAAKLRKDQTNLGRIFRELERGPDMKDIDTETLIHWAMQLNNPGSQTVQAIVADIEARIEASKRG